MQPKSSDSASTCSHEAATSGEFYTIAEEHTNTITHALGLCLSGAGLFYLLTYPVLLSQRLIFGIYGFSLFLSYLTSTVYHGIRDEWFKQKLRLMDHAAIYLLIAGTYTPFLWTAGKSWVSTVLLILIWFLALVGVVFKLVVPDPDRFESYSVISYLSMGWFFPFFVSDVYSNLPPRTFSLIVAGGLLYTFGILFYLWESLPHNHAIWHLFTIVAAAAHFWAVLRLLFGFA